MASKLDNATTINKGLANPGGYQSFTTRLDTAKLESEITDKEREIYNVYKKRAEGKSLTKDESLTINYMEQILAKTKPEVKKVQQARSSFINDRIAKISASYIPENYVVDAAKPETRYRTQAVVSAYLDNAANQKESVGASPNFDYDIAKKVNADKETLYKVHKQGDQAYISLNSAGEKTQYIPVEVSELNRLYDNRFNRPFDKVKETLLATGNKTTNIRGSVREDANNYSTSYFLRKDFPNVTEYGVRGDIEGLQGGGYQFRFYIFDKDQDKWVTRVSPVPYNDENELLQKISQTGNQTIRDLLSIKKN